VKKLFAYIFAATSYFMQKLFFLMLFFMCFGNSYAQNDTLPFLNIKSVGTRVIVSWKQNYKKVIATLNIQRSYDSLKNFRTIGEVLSPQSVENGFIDANPPYRKMYYRIFVAFEGGTYEYSKTYRAKKDTSKNIVADKQFPTTMVPEEKLPWLVLKPGEVNLSLDEKPKITYPSQRIYTLKDNNVLITLPNTNTIKYSIKFYDEMDKFLFEIKRVKEDNFIIEKVNFGRSGWYKFEVFENGELIESNKFQIVKPLKGL
jgi:hypothetical protein